MKLRYFPLWAALFSSPVWGRVVLLYVDTAAGPRVSVLPGRQASLLDGATDPVLYSRPDPDPCAPGAKPVAGQQLTAAPSEAPRFVAGKSHAKVSEALVAAAPGKGEPVTLYSLSWERRLELRGITVVPFPSEATLPLWIRSDYGRTIAAIGAVAAKAKESPALLLYADLGGAGLGPDQWREWGVPIPADAPSGSSPFLTRQDFSYRSGVANLTLRETPTSRPHRVQFYIRSPWTGRSRCAAAAHYPDFQKERIQQESRLLSELTGWPLPFVLSKVGIYPRKSDVEMPLRP